MKKYILAVIALIATLSAGAQINGAGYYRVQNYATQRYIYVIDNQGSLNYAATSADMHALTLWNDLNRAISDPASIIYVEPLSQSDYNFAAQGTSVEDLIGLPAKVRAAGDNKYLIYGSKDGITKYLGDGEKGDIEQGYMTDNARNDERYWNFHPLQTQGTNYFGVKPQFQAQGKYYATMMASWPFSMASQGMEALKVTLVDSEHGIAVVQPVGSAVAGGVPVIFRTTGANPSENRLNIGNQGVNPSDNLLRGTYFDFIDMAQPRHIVYDPATMRVLGTDGQGKAAFITSSTLNIIPANTCYLPVPADSPAEYRIMSPQEYDAFIAALPVAVSGISLDKTQAELKPGQTLTLHATVLPANASDKTVTWFSSSSCAGVDASGKVTANSVGQAVITASAGNFSATCTINITPIEATSLTLNPTQVNLTEGETSTLSVTVSPANATNKDVTFSSDRPDIASVNSQGLISAAKPGNAIITARCGSLTATCNVTVKAKIIPVTGITLSASVLEMIEGETQVLTTTVQPQNATDKAVTWSSDNQNIVTVSETGHLNALAAGQAVITASCSGFSAQCRVTVKARTIAVTSVTISEKKKEVQTGDKFTLTATYLPQNATITGMSWTTDNPVVATVNQQGEVTALAPGICTITVHAGECTDACQVTVKARPVPVEKITLNPSSLTMQEGEQKVILIEITPLNADFDKVTWKSSNDRIAIVTDNGIVTAVAAGECDITVSAGGISEQCHVIVTTKPIAITSISLDPTTITLHPGETGQINATILPENHTGQVAWMSANPDICTISADGLVTAVAQGKTYVTLSAVGNASMSASTQVIVVPESGISDVESAASEIQVNNMSIKFISANSHAMACIYNLSGQIISTLKAGETAEMLINGIYFVKTASETYKIVL